MSEALDLATKETYQLVGFAHGGGTAYYTDWTSDVPYNGNLYISTPDMEVKLPLNDGLFGEQPCTVSIPLTVGVSDNDTFAARISNGQVHAAIDCTVQEVLKSTLPGPSQTVNNTFQGRVHDVDGNYRGRRDKIKMTCLPIKARLATIAMGIPCHHLCSNNLGDASCKINLSTSERAIVANVVSIDGREVTMDTNGLLSAATDRMFHRGYIKFENLYLGIQDWRDSAPLVFNMVRQPPAHWVGSNVLVVAGCDKSIEVCRARYANEDNFLGLGYAMPSYHPVFEDTN